MRQLAPAEVLLKAMAVGDPAGAPSVLTGAVVRVLIDKVGNAGCLLLAAFWGLGCCGLVGLVLL